MRKLIKKLNKNTTLENSIIFQKCLNFLYVLRNLMISDEKIIKKKFKNKFNYDINLNTPTTYTEKIQWLKLNDRNPLLTKCADKYKVRDYIKDKIGEDHLVPLFFATKNAKEIYSSNIPDNIPVIIKTNHDSSGGIIIKDKSKTNWKYIQSALTRRLKQNYYYSTQEWEYKNIERRIIVEKLLLDKLGKLPVDCKILCFNGNVRLISMIKDRDLPTRASAFYDKYWNKKNIYFSQSFNSNIEFEKPKNLDKIIILSQILSKEFIHVRVDWLYINDRFYNGEMTFHTGGGLNPFKPEIWEKILGDYITLPL